MAIVERYTNKILCMYISFDLNNQLEVIGNKNMV